MSEESENVESEEPKIIAENRIGQIIEVDENSYRLVLTKKDIVDEDIPDLKKLLGTDKKVTKHAPENGVEATAHFDSQRDNILALLSPKTNSNLYKLERPSVSKKIVIDFSDVEKISDNTVDVLNYARLALSSVLGITLELENLGEEISAPFLARKAFELTNPSAGTQTRRQ